MKNGIEENLICRNIEIDNDFEIDIRDRNKKYYLGNAHSHGHYEFYYLLRGEINYFIDDKIYPVKKGDVILIPPHVIHKTVPCENYKHSRILLNIKPEFLKEFLVYEPDLFDFFKVNLIPATYSFSTRIETILQTLLSEYNKDANPVMMKSLVGELFTILRRTATENEDRLKIEYINRNSCSDRILGIVRYINSKYQRDISLNELSQEFFMSPTYLSRTFKKIMGTTYSDYIKSVRINNSIYYLLNTDENITEIATQAGFNSSNHFCKTFKDTMGISPLKYRQSYSESEKKKKKRRKKSEKDSNSSKNNLTPSKEE